MTVAARPPAATIGTVLKRPGFFLLVFGQTISQLGDKLHHMALIALVGAGARVETGGLELAKLSVVFTAPVVLMGPLAGALVDRWNKRLTMLVCDALRVVVVALMPWLYRASGHLWAVYVAAFAVFLLGVFFNSAKMALIPELVERDQLLPANAALTSIGRVATVVGIVGGGLILSATVWSRLGWSGYVAGFYLDALSFFASVVTLVCIIGVSGFREPRHAASRALVSPRRLASDVRKTLAVVRTTPGLRFAFGSQILLALFASTVYVVMTVSVQTLMAKGTAGVGYLGGTLAAGMVVGSLAIGSVRSRLSRERIITVGIFLIGVLMIAAGLWFSYRMFVPVAFLGGALLAPIMVAQDTLLHEHGPVGSRGAIFSSKDLTVAGSFALFAFLVGGGIYLLGMFGVQQPFRVVLWGVGVAIACLAWGLSIVQPAIDRVGAQTVSD